MLRKLIKHEWLATKRIQLPINLALLLITFVGCLFLGTDVLQTENSLPLIILLILGYTLLLVALVLVSSIHLLVRFYRNLFTREGYLMFTLPVTPVQLLNSKLIVGYIWASINTLICFGSIAALFFSTGYYSAVHGDSTQKGAFLTEFSSLFTGNSQDMISFTDMFGYSLPVFLLLLAVLFLIGNFFSLAMGYLAIALGQLFEKYKLGCSIGFYIAFYVAIQVLFSIVLIAANLPVLADNTSSLLEFNRNIYHTVLPYFSIFSLVLGIVFYCITAFIMRKRVNLD